MATFYIEALEATTITLSKVGSPTAGDAMYGINDSSVPDSYAYGSDITLSAGQKCYWTITSTTTAFTSPKYLKFTSTGRINVGGNLSDLIGGETAIPRDYCFCGLFRSCDKLIDASNLVMVNNFNSKTNCYRYMFEGCTSLTSAPQLPATTLTTGCYYYMFGGCTSLTSAPELPATTLSNNCYESMFYQCASLTSPPQLPATTLATNCYEYMFYYCTSLEVAPELPATTLADYCYNYMFSGCASLTSVPELPATTLAENCYYCMFQNCTSLTSAPQLPATTLANFCYQYMFSGCTNIKLSETQTGNYQIPYRIPSSSTGTVGTSSLTDMFASTGGTFTGTPTINTTYYMPKTSINIQLKDNDLKLYPKTTLHNIKDFPAQEGESGKFLTTNGTNVSWANVDALPAVEGNGKALVSVNGEWVEQEGFPYKEESEPFFTWDGNREGKESVLYVYYQITSTIIDSPTDLLGCIYKENIVTNGVARVETTTISDSNITEITDDIYMISGTKTRVLAVFNDTEYYGNIFLKGFWGSYVEDSNNENYAYPLSLGHPYTIYKIDTDYLPISEFVFSINQDDTLSVSFEEIQSAISAGKKITCIDYRDGYLDLVGTYEGRRGLYFSSIKYTGAVGLYIVKISCFNPPQIEINRYIRDFYEIPEQEGQNGKFLTTDGTVTSWASVDALPAQSGQNGKFLTTNGSSASWAQLPESLPPVTTADNGKVLAVVNGAWAVADLQDLIASWNGGNF